MKRFLAAFCACLFGFCGLMTGCSRDQANAAAVQVVCTIFPEYDWVRQIVGDVPDVAVTLLIQGGTDLHSYQPSVKDIAAIAKADLFCYRRCTGLVTSLDTRTLTTMVVSRMIVSMTQMFPTSSISLAVTSSLI